MKSCGLDPQEPYKNAKSAWRCLCIFTGKETSPTFDKVKRKSQHICIWCAHNPPIDPKAAVGLMRAAQLEPLVPFPGKNNIPWLCRCLMCGNDTTPMYLNVQRRGHTCSACGRTRSGFKPLAQSLVYLCVHYDLGALKVGVGSPTSVRLATHRRRGWVVVTTRPTTGSVALAIERHILDWWRNDLGLPPYLSVREMQQGGWTETVDLDAVDMTAVIERIQIWSPPTTVQTCSEDPPRPRPTASTP